MHNFIDLEPYGDNRELRMIVETPRGSNIKLEYEVELRAFTVSRALPLGLVYPYDWGLIPGTKGEDGDPIDGLAVHDGAPYPGVILPCRPLGVVELVQKGATGPIENPRLILMQFFLSATLFTDKQAKVTGRHGPKAAHKLVNAS